MEIKYFRQIEDEDIFNEAQKEDRSVITINYKDFRKLVKKGKQGIIAIPSGLSNDEIDLLLTNFVASNDPDECLGRAIKLTDQGLRKTKIRSN